MGRRARAVERAEALTVAAEPELCWLCERPIGAKVERHHVVPKSRGGRSTEPVHPICHRTLHARWSNKELEALGGDAAALRVDEEMGRFVTWVAGKEPDFHAPTRRKRVG